MRHLVSFRRSLNSESQFTQIVPMHLIFVTYDQTANWPEHSVVLALVPTPGTEHLYDAKFFLAWAYPHRRAAQEAGYVNFALVPRDMLSDRFLGSIASSSTDAN